MAYSTLHSSEQEFLKIRILEVFRRNTDQTLSISQAPKSFEPLLKDICIVFQKLNIIVGIKEIEDGAQLNFETQDDNLTYSCSWRSLRDFFYNSEKTKNDTAFLKCIYYYISNGTLEREVFWKLNPDVYPIVSQLEISNLLQQVWDKYKKEVILEASFHGIVPYLLAQIPFQVDACLNEEELSRFIEKPFSDYPGRVAVVILNSLYYFVSDGKLNRSLYLNANVDFLKDVNGDLENKEDVELKEDRRPFYALSMIAGGVIIFLYFLCFSSNWWLPLLITPIVFWGLGWFFALKLVMENIMKSGGIISKFWIWWFGESAVTTNTLSGKVKIGIVHDDSFEVQTTITELRQNFKFVQLIEFKVGINEIGTFEHNLTNERIEGLFILFTKNVYSNCYGSILSFSLKNHDIPMVYKKFSRLDDQPIEFGYSSSNSGGGGLWHLLSQAIKRTKRWRIQAYIFREYCGYALRLLIICIFACLLGMIIQMFISKNQVIKIEKYGQHVLDLSGPLLKHIKDQWIVNFDPHTTSFNLSINTIDSTKNRLNLLTRSDLMVNNDPGYFELSGPGISVCAYHVLNHDPSLLAVYSIKDSLGNFKTYKLGGDYKVEEIEGCIFSPDPQPSRNNFLKGFFCIMERKKKVLITLDIQYDTAFIRNNIENDENRRRFYDSMSKVVSNIVETFDFSLFPEPTKRYN